MDYLRNFQGYEETLPDAAIASARLQPDLAAVFCDYRASEFLRQASEEVDQAVIELLNKVAIAETEQRLRFEQIYRRIKHRLPPN